VDLNQARVDGLKVWDILIEFLVDQGGGSSFVDGVSGLVYVFDTAAITIFLRTLILQSTPNHSEHTSRLAAEHVKVVEEGLRLQARLPVYLAQRQAILAEHCPLLPPLLALVYGYEGQMTIDERWATGLGASHHVAARARPLVDNDALLRRSARLAAQKSLSDVMARRKPGFN
jgi:hypothetical protein